jgi:hypothetical protein
MEMVMKKLVLCLSVLATSPAWASPDSGDKRKGTDVVCRNMKETGSRLATTRICMTRTEWAEQKRTQRADLERAQSNRIPPGAQ